MPRRIITTLDEVFAIMKEQNTNIKAMDTLVQSLSDTIIAQIKDSATVEEAATKAEAILAVAKENSAALIAAANVNTPTELPTDPPLVTEFESLPPQDIDKPETPPTGGGSGGGSEGGARASRPPSSNR